MTQLIAVVDYGMGNLRSVAKALEHAGGEAVKVNVTSDPKVVRDASRVVFPGQGAMGDCMRALHQHGLVDAITNAMKAVPFLGICVGFQALFNESEEDGGTLGLGLCGGHVKRFTDGVVDEKTKQRLKVPHMGWNQVEQAKPHPLWNGIDNHARFYFVHSYHVQPDDWSISTGDCVYGERFCASAAGDGWFATQFHPEKSAADGLQLLTNFLKWDGSD